MTPAKKVERWQKSLTTEYCKTIYLNIKPNNQYKVSLSIVLRFTLESLECFTTTLFPGKDFVILKWMKHTTSV